MEQPPDPFDRLPDEVFQIIFGAILDCKTLVRCMAVSRAFRSQSVRVPSLSIVCPGFFSSYDAKLKGVYMMVKEFRFLESLVVRVGQPKEEPPTWARCMRYAEIGASVDKFVFMAAKSGDFSEFDVEVAEAEITSRSSSFNRQREQSWEMWREELLSRGRAQLETLEDESNEGVDRSDGPLGNSAGTLHFTMDANKRDPSTSCPASTAEPSEVLESEASRLGGCTSLQVDSQGYLMGKQNAINSTSTDQEGSNPDQWVPSHSCNQRRDRKLNGSQDNASSSNSAINAMSISSRYLEDELGEGPADGPSSSYTGEWTGRSSSHRSQPRQQAGEVDDHDSIMAFPPEVQSSDLILRRLKNVDAYRRMLSGHGRQSYEGWDFVRDRCRLPDFVLRQVIAPSNDVLKRMVPVIVFAIVQGLDEFRDSVPTFIGKFARLRRFIIVDMVESVTVYMREHQIKQIRDQGVSDREGLKECCSSETQGKAPDSEECKKIDNRNPDVRDVENLPDFPLNLEGTPDGDKGKAGRRRVSGKAFKEAKKKGMDLSHSPSSDSGKQKLSMSEDDQKDYDIRRWKGKGIISSDEPPSQIGYQAQEVRYGSEDNIVQNQQQAETSVLLECPSSSDMHAPQSKSSLSRLVCDSPEVDYSSDVSEVSVRITCGWANDRHPCESRDCPRHHQSTICKQQVSPSPDINSRWKLESGGTAAGSGLVPSKSCISLKNVTSSTGVAASTGGAYGPVSVGANQHSRAAVTNDSENSRDEESGEASSSSNFVDKSDSDAPPEHCVADSAQDGGTETGSESDKKERPWFQYFVGLKSGGEGSEVGRMGSAGDERGHFSEREGQGGISRQALKTCSMSETRRLIKESRSVRKSREDSRGFSLRRSHRMTAERSVHRMRHSSLPAGLVFDHADTSGGPGVHELAPEILNSGTGDVEGSVSRVAGALGSESSDCDVAVVKSMKGKQLMDEDGEDSGCGLYLQGSSSTPQASSSLIRPSYGRGGTPTAAFGIQFQEQGGQKSDAQAAVTVETSNQDTLGGPPRGLGQVSQPRSEGNRLGWIQLREATRGDRPRVGYPPFDRLSRDRSHDRDTWRDRVRRRARDHRRDVEGDKDRRERMRDCARKRQRDIETEALYFDISFWRTEQVVARDYTLSDVSMCVATHCARPLTTEELDILSRAALAGPLLAATIGYVNKQVSSHNL